MTIPVPYHIFATCRLRCMSSNKGVRCMSSNKGVQSGAQWVYKSAKRVRNVMCLISTSTIKGGRKEMTYCTKAGCPPFVVVEMPVPCALP